MTISQLIRGRSTITQLDILMRADRMFANSVGRYYGGHLTEEQILILDPPPRNRTENQKEK